METPRLARANTARPRRRRLPDQESRRRLLEAGTAMVEETGLTVGLAHLSFEEIIRRADVARSAAYKLWATKDAYYLDVLHELTASEWQTKLALNRAAMAEAIEVLASHQQKLKTPAGRRWLLEEVIRCLVPSGMLCLSQSFQWRSSVSIMVTPLPSGSEEIQEIRGWLRESEQKLLSEIAEFYSAVAAVLGLQLRDPVRDDFLSLATAGAAMVEGMALRRIRMDDVDEAQHQIQPGESRGWSLAAITFLGVVDAFMEVDPHYDGDLASNQLAKLYENRAP